VDWQAIARRATCVSLLEKARATATFVSDEDLAADVASWSTGVCGLADLNTTWPSGSLKMISLLSAIV
jgi:hypothetical protein